MAAKSIVSFKGEKMINGDEESKKGRKPSEKEEYKEGDDETAEMAEEKTHCNASFTLVRPPPSPDPPLILSGNGPQATVSGAEGGDVQLS